MVAWLWGLVHVLHRLNGPGVELWLLDMSVDDLALITKSLGKPPNPGDPYLDQHQVWRPTDVVERPDIMIVVSCRQSSWFICVNDEKVHLCGAYVKFTFYLVFYQDFFFLSCSFFFTHDMPTICTINMAITLKQCYIHCPSVLSKLFEKKRQIYLLIHEH